ncbi:MAG: hypothetical protein QXU18_00150 [Thermoplasmatales archaeon]
MRRILKGFKMKHSKPYQIDYRKPNDAVIGFFDEAAPQTSSNTVRMGSFTKPIIIKNTTKFRANTSGFYAFNGHCVVETYPNSRQVSVMDFLHEIKLRNPFNHIMIILDNFSAHRTE